MNDKNRLNSLYGLSARAPHISRMSTEYNDLCVRLDKLCKYYDANSGLLDDKQRINYEIQYWSF